MLYCYAFMKITTLTLAIERPAEFRVEIEEISNEESEVVNLSWIA